MRKLMLGLLVTMLVIGAATTVIYVKGTRSHQLDAGALAEAAQISATMTPEQRIDVGRYLATVANCAGCHTVAGGATFAGGTPLATAFGTFFGPNITPSREQGIGDWSAEDFWQAMHNGKSPDGSLLYPAFPYTEYTSVTRSDSDAIYAYLMSVPADETPSKDHILRFPYDQRPLLAFWRARYFKAGDAETQEAPASQTTTVPLANSGSAEMDTAPPSWLRGKYLVEGLGHCASCHTPRDSWGATQTSAAWEGGLVAATGWTATPLTNDMTTGMGRWSEQDIVDVLKTGVSRHGTASGPMGDVVRESTQFLKASDLRSIAIYIKSLPAGPASTPATPPSSAIMEVGAARYTQYCAQCHGAQGEGNTLAWPPLRDNISVVAPSANNVIRMILDGGFAPATASDPQPHGMPPFSQTLNDNDVAALATYIRNSWGNQAGEVRAFEVKQLR